MEELIALDKRIGLVGVGLVGSGIAGILLDEGIEVVGFDVDQECCERLDEMGGTVAGSGPEVGKSCKFVILCLPDSGVVGEVLLGSEGLLSDRGAVKYVIDTTTGAPEDSERFAGICSVRGIAFLDATISGSSRQIATGDGVFMVGGDLAQFERCEGILKLLSGRVFYMGPSGSGSKAKLASNLILGLNRAALAEGLVFAERLGLNLESFLELVRVTPAYSVAMDSKGAKMVREDFKLESRMRQHYKDVELMLAAANKAGQELPLSSVHRELLEKAIAAGDGELDNAAIIREIRRRKQD